MQTATNRKAFDRLGMALLPSASTRQGIAIQSRPTPEFLSLEPILGLWEIRGKVLYFNPQAVPFQGSARTTDCVADSTGVSKGGAEWALSQVILTLASGQS
jgi:hypothetical protein